MSVQILSLVIVFVFYGVFLLLLLAIMRFIPKSFLGESAKAVINCVPPFLGGEALRNWAAALAERSVRKRLAAKSTGEKGASLAKEVEEIAMRAMLPQAEPADLERVVACPEAGQGLVGVTAPEVLAIAAFIRKHKSRAEQKRIHDLAVENAKIITSQACSDCAQEPLPCALKGKGHVCSTYAARPLHCRPLHAISVANDLDPRPEPPEGVQEGKGHEQTVAQGIEIGMTRALKSAGLDANVYELNSALATALENPDAEERWGHGESVFHDPLPALTARSTVGKSV